MGSLTDALLLDSSYNDDIICLRERFCLERPFSSACAEKLNAVQDAWRYEEAKRCEDTLHDVVVQRMSGESLEIQFPDSATIGNVKATVQRMWGLEQSIQKMVFGESVVGNCDTVGSLAAGLDGGPIHLTLISDGAHLRCEHDSILLEIKLERRCATNTSSMARLIHLSLARDALEQTMNDIGIEFAYC